MEQTKYLIGDVANLIGMSRDTLRHYEKLGILSSEKGDNGYRYYTDEDISRLVGIMYQRKMDIGLGEIADLWDGDSSIARLSGILEQRLKEEELEIRRHRQTVARLKMAREDCENIRSHLDRIAVMEFPKTYVIDSHTDIRDSIPLYFQYSREYSGLDMMYVFDEYTWKQSQNAMCIDYKNSQLVLKQDVKKFVDYDFPEYSSSLNRSSPCVSAFRLSTSRIPSAKDIEPMVEWAKEQGLTVSHQLYCTFTLQGMAGGEQAYYLQLYLPLVTPQ